MSMSYISVIIENVVVVLDKLLSNADEIHLAF